MSQFVLHCCCGPCCCGCVNRSGFIPETADCTLFYSNSNLDSYEEYERRLEALTLVAQYFQRPLVIDPYDHEAWLAAVRGLESEPEHGARCEKCFRFNLERTARFAGNDTPFATTLTVSPAKSSQVLFKVGAAWSNFVPLNFKKKNGYLISTRLAAALGLYRQNYCGCEFSRKSN